MRVPSANLSRVKMSGITLLAIPLALGLGYIAAGGTSSGGSVTPIKPSASNAPDSVSGTPAASPSAVGSSGGVVPVGSTATALLAGHGKNIWRWVGNQTCPGDAGGTVSRSADEGATWTPVADPGGAVVRIDAASASSAAITVLDPACARQVLTTDDGGATWDTLDASGTLRDLSLGAPDGRWALRGNAVVRDVDGVFTAVSAAPCVGTDVAPPSFVTAISATEAHVVCQGSNGSGRLLVRTRDGGATWARLAGKRPESGLVGGTRVESLRFGSTDRGIALLTSDRCPGGDLRISLNAGALWSTLPCVAVGPKVPQLLTAVISANGVRAVGRLDGRLVMLHSADGRAWTAVPV